ncbi:MAG: sortase [Ruminococcaceae bacterium]|nr:sortase [Oscillospiraceae bacterium]
MNKIFKALLMLLPAILIISLVFVLTHKVFTDFTSNNVFASVLLSSDSHANNTSGENQEQKEFSYEIPASIEYSNQTITTIDFASQWAILNVKNWSERDIPVYFGDTYDILTKGAGSWIGSSFCGQGKNCIISANVMTHFYELEDCNVGNLVTVNTLYGAYEYEVCDKYVFSEDDIDMLYEENNGDTLILHTSYPRSLGIYDTSERIAVICTLKRGTIYKNTFDK